MNLFVLNLILSVVWAVITGNLWWGNFIFGFAIGFLALWLLRHHWGARAHYFSRLPRLLILACVFLYELVLASLRVARDTLRPGFRFRPAIIALPLAVDGDAEITLLANLITLTPGTLSLDVSADRRVLYIHAMDARDAEAVKRDIKQGFERRIMEALR